jgi:hypothetical protein
MWRLILPALAAVACLTGGCGQMAGDCSGGSLSGNTCIPYPGVHWTDAKATAAALQFNYSYRNKTFRGMLTEARCRIVKHLRYYEAKSLCKAIFASPGHAPRRVVVAFNLSGHGVLFPDCSKHWKTNPYCVGKGRVVPFNQ